MGRNIRLNEKTGAIELGSRYVTDGDRQRVDGDLMLRDNEGRFSVHLDGGSGRRNPTTKVYVDGKNAKMHLGNRGTDGRVTVADKDGNTKIDLNAEVPQIAVVKESGTGVWLFSSRGISVRNGSKRININAMDTEAPGIDVLGKDIRIKNGALELVYSTNKIKLHYASIVDLNKLRDLLPLLNELKAREQALMSLPED